MNEHAFIDFFVAVALRASAVGGCAIDTTRLASPLYTQCLVLQETCYQGYHLSSLIRVYALLHIVITLFQRPKLITRKRLRKVSFAFQTGGPRPLMLYTLHQYSWLPDVLRVKNSVRLSLSTARSAGLVDNPRLCLALSGLY